MLQRVSIIRELVGSLLKSQSKIFKL